MFLTWGAPRFRFRRAVGATSCEPVSSQLDDENLIPEDWLTGVLGQFARSHPKVRVEVRAEQNVAIIERLVQGELDLALTWGADDKVRAEPLVDLPMVWIGRPDWTGGAAVVNRLAEILRETIAERTPAVRSEKKPRSAASQARQRSTGTPILLLFFGFSF